MWYETLFDELKALAYVQKEPFCALKIRQNAFLLAVVPRRTPLGKLTTLPGLNLVGYRGDTLPYTYPPHPTRRRELPQRGPVRNHTRKRILAEGKMGRYGMGRAYLPTPPHSAPSAPQFGVQIFSSRTAPE